MLNSIETYADTGRKAARATLNHDSACATAHHAWLSRALRLETPTDRQIARAAFDAAYREEYNERTAYLRTV